LEVIAGVVSDIHMSLSREGIQILMEMVLHRFKLDINKNILIFILFLNRQENLAQKWGKQILLKQLAWLILPS